MSAKSKLSLFGKEIESFENYHPGGCYNLRLASIANKDERKLLFMSYHTGVNINRVRQIAKLNGFNTPNIIKVTSKNFLCLSFCS